MKKLSKLLLALALVSLVGCSSSKSDDSSSSSDTKETTTEATYKAGEYTASAKGMGDVSVTVTFDDTSITDVELDVSNETESIGQAAADELKQQVLDAQSADIDGVSGATITSTAVSDAVADCIEQAKA